MSDDPTWAQRKAWNNDGMDPDWRPNSRTKKTVGTKIDALVDAAKALARVPINDETQGPGVFVQINIPARYIHELRQALRDLEKELE